ncbi:hypothetical protein BGZ63DRAFT_4729 [Mariannaea sp. PMI_226]|nr:hypothetical protein BGZ63DRAFT_4729 [Mariannaea sp. PMI_226]
MRMSNTCTSASLLFTQRWPGEVVCQEACQLCLWREIEFAPTHQRERAYNQLSVMHTYYLPPSHSCFPSALLAQPTATACRYSNKRGTACARWERLITHSFLLPNEPSQSSPSTTAHPSKPPSSFMASRAVASRISRLSYSPAQTCPVLFEAP